MTIIFQFQPGIPPRQSAGVRFHIYLRIAFRR
jgi:hypothetical protein